MENILQKADKIDLVYAINEPAAYGGYAALKAAGKEKGIRSSPSTAAARASNGSRTASLAQPPSNIRC